MNWASVKAARESTKIRRPENSFNTVEYAAEYKLSLSGAREHLRRLVSLGKLKKTVVIEGTAQIPYYTLVESTQEPDHATTERTNGRPRRRNGRYYTLVESTQEPDHATTERTNGRPRRRNGR